MIMMTKTSDDGWATLLHKVLKPFEEESRTVIYLIGKAARMDATQYAELHDVDLLVIGESYENPCVREVMQREGFNLDITCVDLNALENRVAQRQSMWIEMLAQGKWLSGCNSRVESLVTQCEKLWDLGPGLPDAATVKRIRFEFGQLTENLERTTDESNTFSFLAAYSIHKALTLYFELNGVWIPKAKKMMSILYKLDGNLHGKVSAYLAAENEMAKLEHLENVIAHMLKPHGGKAFEFSKDVYPIEL